MAAIVGGADSLCLTTLHGFHSLGLNAPGPMPAVRREARRHSIGEAAGFVLLERGQPRGGGTVHLSGCRREQTTLTTCLRRIPRERARDWRWSGRLTVPV